MKQRSILLSILLIPFFLKSQDNSLQQINLQSFIAMAQGKSLDNSQAELDLHLATLDNQIFQAQFKPQVTGFANFPNYSRSFQEITQPNGTIEFQPIQYNNSSVGLVATQQLATTGGQIFVQSNLQRFDDFGNDLTSYNGLPIRIGINQPLFDFNPWKWQKKIQPLQQKIADKKYLYDQEQIRLDATRLFFDLLVAHQDLEIASTNLSNNTELAKIAEERYELGKISQNDLLQLKLEGISAQRNQKAATQAVRLASAAIYNYLGMPYEGEIIEPQLPDNTTLFNPDEATALQYAEQNRFETNDYLLQIMTAERDLEQAQKEAGINMNLSASIGYSRSAKDIETIYTSPQQEQFLQVSLNVPILNWGQDKARIKQQQIQLDFTRQSVQRQRQQFNTEIKNTVYRVATVQEQLLLAKELQELTQQRFEIARQSFVLGSISTTELGIAQQEKDFAMRDYILTLNNYWIAFYELRRNTLYDFVNEVPL